MALTRFSCGMAADLGHIRYRVGWAFGSGPYGRVTFLSGKVTKAIAPGLGPSGFPPSGVAPGARVAKGLPAATLTRLLPRLPLRNASTRPAPTSRSAASGPFVVKIKIRSKADGLSLSLLLLFPDGTDAANRDVGAGRTQATRSRGARHGCRASADGPWTALRRGPVERRRSEGSPKGPSPEQCLCLLCAKAK